MLQRGQKKILIKEGDITQEITDAIVNPANGQLRHGGGAAAAIVAQGGGEIQQESDLIIHKSGFLPTGKAVITGSGRLPCKYVIHTVGPRMGEGQEAEKLRKAVWSALTLAELYNLSSLSMPSISSGIFGFPKEECAEILLQTSWDFLQQPEISLQTVIMCNRDRKTCQIFQEKIKKY